MNGRHRPTLVVVAHGTQLSVGVATITRLTDALRARLPDVRVELAFVDVLEPSLPAVLTADLGPTVVVPALLSAGYHVAQDIPAAVAGRNVLAATTLSRHLGPDPLLTTALLDRLAGAREKAGVGRVLGPTALVATGSSDPAARDDLVAAAADLSRRLGRQVQALTLADVDIDDRLAGCAEVASYLLAEGIFAESLRDRAAAAGIAVVSDVLGAHDSVVQLLLQRYDEAAGTLCAQPVDCSTHPAR